MFLVFNIATDKCFSPALPPTFQFFHLFYFIVFKLLPFATTVILPITVKVTINDAGGCWHSKLIALTSPKP